MRTSVSIGDFSRMTHLTIKTLRHYHEVGLLAPEWVDASSGYRYYGLAQVPIAQVIRRLRDMGMPIEEVRAIVSTTDPKQRARAAEEHLTRLEHQLGQTRAAIDVLRALLGPVVAPGNIECRAVSPSPALAIAARVEIASVEAWLYAALAELKQAAATLEGGRASPIGALYATELFEEGEGNATAFVQLARPAPRDLGRAKSFSVPPAELAIITHEGPHTDVDATYAALGTYVAERELEVTGPVREYYLVSVLDTPDPAQWRTEIAWPIFRLRA